MDIHTNQMKKWKSKFGNEYTERNPMTVKEMDELYLQTRGITRTKLDEMFLQRLKINNALEVGSNLGIQLLILNNLGFGNLYGVELNRHAIDISKEVTKGKDIYIIKGPAQNIAFKDSFFDLVFTSGLLIHISPDDINHILDEIHRCSRKYIWGYEYYTADDYLMLDYRGKDNLLWKTDFPKLFLDRFSDLRLIRRKVIKYKNNDNMDIMYLLYYVPAKKGEQ